ncbi:MAG: CidA/LrgA family protein [Sedimentibacter sp.]|uniref:CidA/LrgA family protein n=1 Tax=Sedimentibacter sp. TaxID=1960295 RepID=UPI002980B47D|nr:CidA/LrgA family protein [Sedimentibacter sp.]MDW5299934.1 CidA/LrgA family protein [Sedimentibacter sp.]
MLKNVFKMMIQIAIIYIIYLAGNFISSLISDFVVIPGNIIGMVILLLLLTTNVMKLSMIETAGNLMIKYMGFFFVPLTVGLMDSYKLIQHSIIQILVILLVSCFCVMLISSKVTDLLIIYNERKKTND